MNIFSRLTGATDTSFSCVSLFQTFVFGTLVCISVNIHSFGLDFVNWMASAARLDSLLVQVSGRVMHQTAVVGVD